MQPQGHVQVLLNMLWWRMNAQQALDAPRFCIGAAEGQHRGIVHVEETMDDKVVEALREKGHKIQILSGMERTLFGRGQIITRDPTTGVLSGGSDGRGDGCPMGW